MGKILLCIALMLAALTGSWQFWFSPVAHYKHDVQKSLDALGAAVESQDAANVKATLSDMIRDDAQINLEVYFPVPGQPKKHQQPEFFNKENFLGFVDNMLYSVNNYHFKASVGVLELAADRTSGNVIFSASATARDVSTALMAAASQFSTESDCHGKLAFDVNAKPVISELACEVSVGR